MPEFFEDLVHNVVLCPCGVFASHESLQESRFVVVGPCEFSNGQR